MKILQILQHKDTASYLLTTGAVVFNFAHLNEILTSLVLVATLVYWIQKNIYVTRKGGKD